MISKNLGLRLSDPETTELASVDAVAWLNGGGLGDANPDKFARIISKFWKPVSKKDVPGYAGCQTAPESVIPVSYTHLTLPTILLV